MDEQHLRAELAERLSHLTSPGKPLLNRVGPDYIDPLVQIIWECIQDRAEDKEAARQRLSMAMDGWSKEEKDNQALRARVAELEEKATVLDLISKHHVHLCPDEEGFWDATIPIRWGDFPTGCGWTVNDAVRDAVRQMENFKP